MFENDSSITSKMQPPNKINNSNGGYKLIFKNFKAFEHKYIFEEKCTLYAQSASLTKNFVKKMYNYSTKNQLDFVKKLCSYIFNKSQ